MEKLIGILFLFSGGVIGAMEANKFMLLMPSFFPNCVTARILMSIFSGFSFTFIGCGLGILLFIYISEKKHDNI